jgi:predicted MFS family arabinose efflux permease
MRTDSPLWVGSALALTELPNLVFGVPAGIVADRFDRRKILRIVEGAHAATYLLTGLLLATDSLALWHLLALAFWGGSMATLHETTRLSMAYDVAGPGSYVRGLSLMHGSDRLGGLVGFAITGSVMERIGFDVAYFIMAGISLTALALVLGVRQAQQQQVRHESPAGSLRTLLREIRRNRPLLTLLVITAVVEVVGFSFITALPFVARDVLGFGPEGLGIMAAVGSAGGAGAVLVHAVRGERARKKVIYVAGLVLMSLGLIVLGLSGALFAVLAAVLVIEATAVTSDIMSQALIQQTVANELRGRAMGSWVFAIGVAPLGQLEMGALVLGIGVGAALVVNGGAMLLVASVSGVLVHRLWRSAAE